MSPGRATFLLLLLTLHSATRINANDSNINIEEQSSKPVFRVYNASLPKTDTSRSLAKVGSELSLNDDSHKPAAFDTVKYLDERGLVPNIKRRRVPKSRSEKRKKNLRLSKKKRREKHKSRGKSHKSRENDRVVNGNRRKFKTHRQREHTHTNLKHKGGLHRKNSTRRGKSKHKGVHSKEKGMKEKNKHREEKVNPNEEATTLDDGSEGTLNSSKQPKTRERKSATEKNKNKNQTYGKRPHVTDPKHVIESGNTQSPEKTGRKITNKDKTGQNKWGSNPKGTDDPRKKIPNVTNNGVSNSKTPSNHNITTGTHIKANSSKTDESVGNIKNITANTNQNVETSSKGNIENQNVEPNIMCAIFAFNESSCNNGISPTEEDNEPTQPTGNNYITLYGTEGTTTRYTTQYVTENANNSSEVKHKHTTPKNANKEDNNTVSNGASDKSVDENNTSTTGTESTTANAENQNVASTLIVDVPSNTNNRATTSGDVDYDICKQSNIICEGIGDDNNITSDRTDSTIVKETITESINTASTIANGNGAGDKTTDGSTNIDGNSSSTANDTSNTSNKNNVTSNVCKENKTCENKSKSDENCCNIQILDIFYKMDSQNRDKCRERYDSLDILLEDIASKRACIAECIGRESGYLTNKGSIFLPEVQTQLRVAFKSIEWIPPSLGKIVEECYSNTNPVNKKPGAKCGTAILDLETCIGNRLQYQCYEEYLSNRTDCNNQDMFEKHDNCKPVMPGYGCISII